MNVDWKEVSEYFRRLPTKFNYLILIQMLPLLILSSILIKEMNPSLFHKQMLYYLIGAITLTISAFIPWKKILWWFAPVSYVFNNILLIIVLLFGHSILGAKRWIALPGGLTFQPSEFIKISVVLMLAYMITRDPPPIEGYGFKSFGKLSLIILIPFVLIAKEPDLGTALVLLMTGYGILFLNRFKPIVWVVFFVSSIVIGVIGYKYALHDYQKKRIHDFINKPSYHVRQALIAIGSGGLKGKPKDQATQTQLKFLPISTSDFIFAYLGERFGFSGILFVILVYILLIIHLLKISKIFSDDYLITSVAAGLGFLIFIYTSVNIYMIIGLAPVVGVPLPMFSHGGTSFIIFALFFGILINLIAVKTYRSYNADSKLTPLERDPLKRTMNEFVRRKRDKNSDKIL